LVGKARPTNTNLSYYIDPSSKRVSTPQEWEENYALPSARNVLPLECAGRMKSALKYIGGCFVLQAQISLSLSGY